MMSNRATSFLVPLHKGSTCDNLCIKMQALFEVHDVYEVVEKDYKGSLNNDSFNLNTKRHR